MVPFFDTNGQVRQNMMAGTALICYTVQDLCRKIGVPYEKVLQWARSGYRWRQPDEAVGENGADALEICHCKDNVEMAVVMGRMPFRESLKYVGYTK